MALEELIRSYYDKRAAEGEWQRRDRHRREFAVSMRLLDADLPECGRVAGPSCHKRQLPRMLALGGGARSIGS